MIYESNEFSTTTGALYCSETYYMTDDVNVYDMDLCQSLLRNLAFM